MLKFRCRIKAKKTWTSYTWPVFEVRFTAEVIPYQEHWKRVNKVESYNYNCGVASFSCSLLFLGPKTY